jgi:serine/threonine protein kinase
MNDTEGQSVAQCLSDELLSDFVGGRLSNPGLEEQLAEHLASCDTCAHRLQTIPRDLLCELLRAEGLPAPEVKTDQFRSNHSLTSTNPLLAIKSEPTSRRDTLVAIECGPELPVKIGSYFVIRKLGQGGFGDVYLARDPLHNRLVAIKVPRADLFESRESRATFLKEARTAAELEHPHIVSTYDCCELDDGSCIVVMEYIEGTTLRGLMRSQRLDHARSATIVAQIAEALDYAHQRGIWHRDVKPANILLDREGKPYLSDFGLAVHEDQQSLVGDELAGTYPYMSPEQVQRQSSRLDGRSDIWSLGVILYELLTGERPFRGTTYEELQEEIPNRTPQPPRSYDATISEKLEQACLKCLEPDPERRFAKAGELAEQLRERPARKPTRVRPRYRTAVLSLAVLAGLTVVALATRDWRRPPPPTTLTPIAWATLNPTDYYTTFPDSSRIAVKSSTNAACFATHEANSTHYLLRTAGEFHSEYGEAGLALGIHEIGGTPPRQPCTVVFVDRYFPAGGTWLTVQKYEAEMNATRHMDLRQVLQIDTQRLSRLSLSSFRLEIEVKRGRIVKIQYNGQPVREMDPKLRELEIPPNTKCGIMAKGHVVFHTLSYEDLGQ